MNIRDSRLKRTMEEVIKTYLQKGILPTSDEVINNVRNHLYKKQINLPFYEYSKLNRDFNIQKLNLAKAEVADDISVASSTILSMYKDIQCLVDKFENEKLRTEYTVNTLESEIISLLSKIADTGYLESFREDFLDMRYVDAKLTSATIDSETNECTLEVMNDTPVSSIKSVELKSNADIITSNKEFNEILQRVINIPGEYSKAIVSSDVQKDVELETIIDIGFETNVSNVDLGIHLLKQGTIKTYVSKDGSTWEPILDTEGKQITHQIIGLMNISIYKNCRYIKFVITKKEADKLNYKGKFEYIYLYDYIRVYQTKYSSTSEFVSTPIEMKNIVNEVSLYVEDELPAGTDIEYYITDDVDNESPNWIKTDPTNKVGKETTSVVLGAKALNRKAMFKLDKDLSEETNKVSEENGIPIYLLGEIDYYNLDRYNLYKSTNSWLMESLVINAKSIDNTTFIKNDVSRSYREITGSRVLGNINGQRDTMIAPTAVRMSSSIVCPKDMSIKRIVTSNYPVYIYLNGKLIYRTQDKSQRGEVKYDFMKGHNRLVVISNINPEEVLTKTERSLMYPILELGFDVRDIGTLMGEGSSMKEVSEYDLRFNNNVSNAYALRLNNDSTKWQILIREDVFEDYEFIYDYLISDNKKIKLRAVLRNNTNQNQITPKLNAFEIRLLK